METKRMTRLSATATIAAVLLLAIAQGFGATSSTKSTTKSSPKVATKSSAKPYHITAKNQFHIKSAQSAKNRSLRVSPALTRFQQKQQERQQQIERLRAKNARVEHQHLPENTHYSRDPLATIGRNAAQRAPGLSRATRVHKQTANPPTGIAGFVSATQIPAGGDDYGQVQAGTLTSLNAFITVVWNGTNYVYSEVTASGTGTFSIPTPTGTDVPTPTVCDCGDPIFVVGDVNGDGNSDIIEYVNGNTINVLLSQGDGTFAPAAVGVGPLSPVALTLPAGATGLTGGTGVLNQTTGFIDLVVVDNNEPSDILTFSGNGDGTFGTGTGAITAATTATFTKPAGLDGIGEDLIIQDFDGDGIVDVMENDDFNNQPVVYLSTASTPYTGTALTTPDGVYDGYCGNTAGSLTGSSGSPAIIEANCEDNTITVYNNSTGTFSEGVYYTVAITPSTTAFVLPAAVTIADVNGDGNGDVVVTNYESSDVIVMLGNGDGTLQTSTGGSVGYATGGYPFDAAIVMDLNGDTLPDILVADDNQGLVWMAGFGDGTFQAARDFYSPTPDFDYAEADNIASGDFNGDGFVDLVVGNFGDEGTGVTVFLSNPDGSLQPGVNYGSGGELASVVVGDFNNDGNLDFAALSYEGHVQIFSGTGTGTFIQGAYYSVGGCCQYGIVSGAFNLPSSVVATGTGTAGFPDIAVVSESANLTMLLNDGTGGFMVQTPPITLNGEADYLAAASLRNTAPGSGYLDLAVAEYSSNQVGILLGNGDGTFATETDVALFSTILTNNYGPYGITLADVSGDSIPDIVATDDEQNLLVATGNGDGTFNVLPPLPASIEPLTAGTYQYPEPGVVQVTDVNGDGFADIVYSNYDYGTVGVIFGQGTGTAAAPTFYDAVEFPATHGTWGITTAAITGNSAALDVAVVNDYDDISDVSTMINANGTAAAPNFSLSSNPSILNISDGATGTAAITLTPINFYSGTVTFSCGGLPLDVTCAFAPATLTPVGNAPLTTTVTITTAAPHGALRMPADANPHQGRTSLLACLTGMGLFGLLLSGDWKNKRNRRVGILLGILVLGMMFSLVGCSSSSTPGTPIGAQTIQVTGTGSDGTTQAASITINVF
jgi:VCBS repeat protein